MAGNKTARSRTLQAIVVATCIGLSGCAKTCNQAERDGGLFTSSTAPYIVLKESGGRIMDVYKLENVMVQSEENSDGWLFQDQYGNPVNIAGDAKVIRLKSTKSDLWNKYHEYHMEFETKTYNELYGQDNSHK